MIFQADYKHEATIYINNPKRVYLPVIEGIVYTLTDEELGGVLEKFLFDTGASVSVLDQKYVRLFSGRQCDSARIQYGNGAPIVVPVYEGKIQIQGIKHLFKFVIDQNLGTKCLLGNVDFMDKFRTINLAIRSKKVYCL